VWCVEAIGVAPAASGLFDFDGLIVSRMNTRPRARRTASPVTEMRPRVRVEDLEISSTSSDPGMVLRLGEPSAFRSLSTSSTAAVTTREATSRSPPVYEISTMFAPPTCTPSSPSLTAPPGTSVVIEICSTTGPDVIAPSMLETLWATTSAALPVPAPADGGEMSVAEAMYCGG